MKILSGLSDQSKYPIVAVRDGIVFPSTENALIFGRNKSILAVDEALKTNSKVVLLMQKNSQDNDPKTDDLYHTGVLAIIKKVTRGERGELSALIQGEARVKVTEFIGLDPYLSGIVERLEENTSESDEVSALIKHITGQLRLAVNLGKGVDFVTLMNIMSGVSARDFSDHMAMILDLKTANRQLLLEELNLLERLKKEADFVSNEVKVLEIEQSISLKTHRKFEKGMKDAVLREKLKTIEEELGHENREDRDIAEMRKKIDAAKLPVEAQEKAKKELGRLSQMSPYNPEASYIRTYLEWLVELPWNVDSKSVVDIKHADQILNEDHFGLGKVKTRILEYLAVLKLREMNLEKVTEDQKNQPLKKQNKQPTILCFVGPPGVGKTSLGRSIAHALGRKFIKISLGGIRDEAEIRGHRRTYVGALPGRMIQGIKQAGTKNPVFMLDEIDKIGADYRGDPSSALLEALDPEQNHAFSDHYLEVPFDLSDVMFITTANILDTIPDALRDRLEIISFPGYTEDEKFNIAKNYLVAKQQETHGLADKKVSIIDSAIKLIIRRYTREAGVRELERQIATIFRKIAREFVEKKISQKKIGSDDINTYLGAYKYSSQMIERENNVGISTGLAWTQVGGDILFIEVAVMPGKGKLTLTGHLGEVMKESAAAALSYIRSRWKAFGLKRDFFEELEIHVHVPEGAVPKDGPSAGIAITSAMVSALTKLPIDHYIGMTGEITLRGRVMEIGGIKEKVIAAHRAGLKTIILPRENKKDLEDIPKYVLSDLKFIFVDHMDEVLKRALVFPTRKFAFAQIPSSLDEEVPVHKKPIAN